MQSNEQVLSFIAEWFDPHPQILKKFLLKYYCERCEVEMKDFPTGRKFLRPTKVPATVSREDFILGGHVLLFSRNLKIVDYADGPTRELLEVAAEKTVVVVASALAGCVVGLIENSGPTVVGMKMLKLGRDGAEEAQRRFGIDVDADSGQSTVAVAFRGLDSIAKVRHVVSSSDYAQDVMCASDAEEVMAFDDFFFTRRRPTTATYSNCTCCVIKPHAIKSRQAGAILDSILSGGYEISALQLFHLEPPAAAEFLEVYDGVVKEFHLMVDELCSGPVVALEIRGGDDNDTVSSFRRAIAGPWDVQMAKELYPDTIRAKFGEDNVQNALHCTDLPKDAVSEVEYFFDILADA